ncbi:hypothetical protein ACRAWD_07640 [Caulobacter segnis]
MSACAPPPPTATPPWTPSFPAGAYRRPWATARFLSASAAALSPLEQALERAGVADWLPDWPARARRAALAQDLAALGLSAPVCALAEIASPRVRGRPALRAGGLAAGRAVPRPPGPRV